MFDKEPLTSRLLLETSSSLLNQEGILLGPIRKCHPNCKEECICHESRTNAAPAVLLLLFDF
jgi:hypothetical protein